MAKGLSNKRRSFASFLVLFVFWLVFSGHYDWFHLGLGLVCAALVTIFSQDLLSLDVRASNRFLIVWRFLRYIPWLLYQIVLANFHVVYLVIYRREIHPQIIRFKTSLTSDLAQVTLANSITLTPGTITMDIEDGEFYVHALSNKVARDLLSGDMERRVAHVFLESESRVPSSTGSVS